MVPLSICLAPIKTNLSNVGLQSFDLSQSLTVIPDWRQNSMCMFQSQTGIDFADLRCRSLRNSICPADLRSTLTTSGSDLKEQGEQVSKMFAGTFWQAQSRIDLTRLCGKGSPACSVEFPIEAPRSEQKIVEMEHGWNTTQPLGARANKALNRQREHKDLSWRRYVQCVAPAVSCTFTVAYRPYDIAT